jgi:hypothetical protein
VGVILAVSGFIRMRAVSPPPVIVLSVCPTVASGVQRFRADFGTQFDVSETNFTVAARTRDMPPGTLYTVTLKDRGTNMIVWHDDELFRELKDTFPVFSRRVGEKNIRTQDGRVVGKDHWGVLNDGERWRYVTFSAGDAAGYHPVAPGDARLFDRVLSSACISTSP